MNASPIKSKCSSTADSYLQNILDLENLMNSKVPTSARTGNVATLSFMKWIGMDIDIIDAPILRNFIVKAKNLVNVRYLEITATLQVS
ncbi:hypothetical protein EJD97_017762 [Solanum chilense]|uniref:Uncharacterized protein n=1 Tax=Solanum chilense TaxID=4083 RepID=A0A6N2B6C7_SOLCI|nr:hypothetical protein EJD97_017762 [Solanum chilense]